MENCMKKIKIIKVTAITYSDKEGNKKKITAKQNKELFKELTVILKTAQKKGNINDNDFLH
jgi:hypothetical protein